MVMKHVEPSENYASVLARINADLSKQSHRIVPSSFNPDDPNLRALPIPLSWRWDSCAALLSHFEVEIVMTLLPLFWQLAAPLQEAVQSAKAALYIGDVENMPVNEVAIRAGIDCVVISAADAPRFAKHLMNNETSLPNSWILIHDSAAHSWATPEALRKSTSRIAHEVHLFPGCPILFQSPKLADTRQPHFLLSDAFTWNISDTQTSITSSGATSIPLCNVRLPFLIEVVGSESGKSVVRRRV